MGFGVRVVSKQVAQESAAIGMLRAVLQINDRQGWRKRETVEGKPSEASGCCQVDTVYRAISSYISEIVEFVA